MSVRISETGGARTGGGAAAHEYTIEYFAVLRERVGSSRECVESAAATPAALYQELCARYAFPLDRRLVRVAVNDAFSSWDAALTPGDRVAFIPPVAGG